jgi:hypothetical protein
MLNEEELQLLLPTSTTRRHAIYIVSTSKDDKKTPSEEDFARIKRNETSIAILASKHRKRVERFKAQPEQTPEEIACAPIEGRSQSN